MSERLETKRRIKALYKYSSLSFLFLEVGLLNPAMKCKLSVNYAYSWDSKPNVVALHAYNEKFHQVGNEILVWSERAL